MRIDILTLFTNMFSGPFDESILKRAAENKLIEINLHDLRDFGVGKHQVVDDAPHGGGAGMMLMPEPLFNAVESITGGQPDFQIILLTPQGRLLNQTVARELAAHEKIILICGHYEGVDERVRQHLVTDEISIGDFVLTGGELPAMVMVDVIARHIPGVLGSEDSAKDDSHQSGLLEYPQYTRPREFRGWEVPPVLLSGNHAEIAKWRHEQSILRTHTRRPDMLENNDSGKKE